MATVDIDALVHYQTALQDNHRWKGFESRPGDVFVCTPPKCGTTWTQVIVGNLFWPDGDWPCPIMHLSPWIEAEFMPIEAVLDSLQKQTHRRVIKSHTAADGVPWFDDAKYVVVVRDGRDAFMSLCNHMDRMKMTEMLDARAAEAGLPGLPKFDGDVHGFFAEWVADDDHFFHIVASYWERRHQPNLLLVHYADLKADLRGEIARIAEFLGTEVTPAQLDAITNRCSFEYMRDHTEMTGDFEMGFEGGNKGFIFKGTNGRWRDVLTRDELDAYDRKASEHLSEEALAWVEKGGHV